jgi:hypothetical protein
MTDASANPSTPAEAAARLDQLAADAAWRNAFLSGNGPEAKQFHELTTMAESARQDDEVEMALKGQLYDAPFQPSEHLENIALTQTLREAGLTDDVIRQAVRGDTVTQAEHDAAKRAKESLLRDNDFVRKFLEKNGPEFERMMLIDVILTSPIKAEKAA